MVQRAANSPVVLGRQRKLLSALALEGVHDIDDEAVVFLRVFGIPAQAATDALQIQTGIARRAEHGDQIQRRQIESFGQAQIVREHIKSAFADVAVEFLAFRGGSVSINLAHAETDLAKLSGNSSPVVDAGGEKDGPAPARVFLEEFY